MDKGSLLMRELLLKKVNRGHYTTIGHVKQYLSYLIIENNIDVGESVVIIEDTLIRNNSIIGDESALTKI